MNVKICLPWSQADSSHTGRREGVLERDDQAQRLPAWHQGQLLVHECNSVTISELLDLHPAEHRQSVHGAPRPARPPDQGAGGQQSSLQLHLLH